MKVSSSSSTVLAVVAFFAISASNDQAVAFQSRAVLTKPDHPSSALFSTVSQRLEDLPTPPKKTGFLRRFRDTVAMFRDPDGTIAKRSEELGPVFEIYQFFKPVVVVGGQDAVKEFISGSELKSEVIYPDLPDTFLDLHTKWGALNLDANDQIFKEARLLFADVLSSVEAMTFYTKTIEPEIDAYVEKLAKRIEANPEDNTVYLAPEMIELTLQIFSKIFSGKGLTPEQVQMFVDYNSGLLSISKNTDQFRKAKDALETLREEMFNRFNALADAPEDAPGKFYHSKVFGREGFENPERIGTGILLFVWGAYVECASLMANSLALMTKYDDETNARENILKEFELRMKAGDSTPQDYSFWSKMDYTRGVLRESLRLEPPGAGVPRYAYKDFELAGYRIPAKTAVVMEPRIGNKDPNLYTSPQKFEPLRWTPATSEVAAGASSSKCPFQGSALKLGIGSWFPGGNGAHKCPGVPLAELVAGMFVTKMCQRFEVWEYNGDGLDKNGDVKYTIIPVKIPPNDFGMNFKLASKDDYDSVKLSSKKE
jgi:cytochrome P450